MSKSELRYRDLFVVLSSELKTLIYHFGDNPKYEVILDVLFEYNSFKPHSSLGDLTPNENLNQHYIMTSHQKMVQSKVEYLG